MQDNKQICESIDHQEFSSVIETGPRHRKLVQAYQKAMEMIMQKCSLEKVRAAFPSILSEISTQSDDTSDIINMDLINLAYSKSMKMFLEKIDSEWESITREMQIFSKLDSLDHILRKNENEQEYQDLIQSMMPLEFYSQTINDILERDIQRMDMELQQIQNENNDIRNQIVDNQNDIGKLCENLYSIQKQWDEIFQSASQLESDLKVPYISL